MVKQRAILLGNDFDLNIRARLVAGKIVSGLVIGDSVYQQQTLLLVCSKGEFKESPMLGVGINNYLLDDAGPDELLQEVSAQFSADGMTVMSLSYTNGKLNTEAYYEESDGFK